MRPVPTVLTETARCRVRPMRQADIPALHEVYSDKAVMEYIQPPFSLAETRDFVAKYGIAERPRVYAIAETNETVIGHLIWHPYAPDSYELGWILRRDRWGRGYASELTEAMLRYAALQGISALTLECDPRQTATIKIAEKFGFRLLGNEDGLLVYRLSIG